MGHGTTRVTQLVGPDWETGGDGQCCAETWRSERSSEHFMAPVQPISLGCVSLGEAERCSGTVILRVTEHV